MQVLTALNSPVLVGGTMAVTMLFATTASLAQQGPPPKPPVTVAAPLEKRVTNWDEYSGRFEAVASVEVRARVSGFVEKIHFQDGQLVKTGDLLISLDHRIFEVAVESALADVAKAEAQVVQTGADVARAEPLLKNNYISGQVADQRTANLGIAKASKLSAEAALKTAQLNLEWSDVRATIDGRISNKRVDIGTLVSGGGGSASTLLTTIVSTNPIHFVFDASEADYLKYQRLAQDGARKSSRETSNPVRIKLADEKTFGHEGKMNFVDNQLSITSGTIRGRAIVDNKDSMLTPGVFGRLQLFAGEVDALLIPDAAIVSDQAQKIVFAVNADNVVVVKPVTLGPLSEGLRVVTGGLDKSMRVVIDGIANPAVRPGAKVEPQPGEVKAAAAN